MTASSSTPRADTLLRIRAASVNFGAVAALRDADLELRRGDFIALIGANGSGKTTLLRLLHGLVAFDGTRDVLDPHARQVMVFQRPFMLRLSVWHNVVLALWLARGGHSSSALPTTRAERRERALQALQRVGLSELRDRPAQALSGGEQQRLALARAWAVRAQIIFLDEPTASLDPSAKKEVEALLAGFHADGLTLVMSTHNLGQAKRLATRVVFLDRGEVHADLPTGQFFTDHVDGRTQLFLKGELSWNLE